MYLSRTARRSSTFHRCAIATMDAKISLFGRTFGVFNSRVTNRTCDMCLLISSHTSTNQTQSGSTHDKYDELPRRKAARLLARFSAVLHQAVRVNLFAKFPPNEAEKTRAYTLFAEPNNGKIKHSPRAGKHTKGG